MMGVPMPHSARWKAQHYRDMAAHFRSLAETEPLASLRRHLRRLAAQHEEVARRIEGPRTDEQGAPRAALG
jgi:hypothetical protein